MILNRETPRHEIIQLLLLYVGPCRQSMLQLVSLE